MTVMSGEDAKVRFLAELRRRTWSRPDADGLLAGFSRLPACYFAVAEHMCQTDDYDAILACVHALALTGADQRRDAARRLRHLRAVPDDPLG